MLASFGAVYARSREDAARGNRPRMSRIAQHLKLTFYEDGCLCDTPPIGQRETNRRMRKLEVPFHADSAVAQPPVRHALTIQTEIDMIRVTNAGSFAAVAFSGVKQTVGEGERPLLIAEVDRPRLTTHTQSDRD